MRWIWYVAAALAAGVLAAPFAARADDAEIAEIRGAWAACEKVTADNTDGWIGWRRDFFNGYGDNFNFWNNRGTQPVVPSVLRTRLFIDGVAVLTTSYCFRTDETLAFVFTVMQSMNAVEGKPSDVLVSREGRLYFGRDGSLLKVLGQVLDDKKQPHPLDNDEWQPMRGCQPLAYYKTAEEVEKAYIAEMGDIEGQRPAFQPTEIDWCAQAAKP
jgi:hypothetical protein